MNKTLHYIKHCNFIFVSKWGSVLVRAVKSIVKVSSVFRDYLFFEQLEGYYEKFLLVRK